MFPISGMPGGIIGGGVSPFFGSAIGSGGFFPSGIIGSGIIGSVMPPIGGGMFGCAGSRGSLSRRCCCFALLAFSSVFRLSCFWSRFFFSSIATTGGAMRTRLKTDLPTFGSGSDPLTPGLVRLSNASSQYSSTMPSFKATGSPPLSVSLPRSSESL